MNFRHRRERQHAAKMLRTWLRKLNRRMIHHCVPVIRELMNSRSVMRTYIEGRLQPDEVVVDFGP